MPDPVNQQTTAPIDTEKLYAPEAIPTEEMTQESVTAALEKTPAEQQAAEQHQEGNNTYTGFERHVYESIKAVVPEYDLPAEFKTGKKADGTPLTEKERYNMLVEQILDHSDLDDDYENDPVLAKYREAKAKGIDFNTFALQHSRAINLLNLDSREFLKVSLASLKNTKGEQTYTEEQINEHLDKKTAIQLDQEAKAAKSRYYQTMLKQQYQVKEKDFQANAENVDKIVNSYLTEVKTKKQLAGFDLSEGEMTEYANTVNDLLKINPQTGQNKIGQMLMSDDQLILDILPFIWMRNSKKYESKLSALKEAVKLGIETKLGDKLEDNSGGAFAKQNGIDVNQLYGRDA